MADHRSPIPNSPGPSGPGSAEPTTRRQGPLPAVGYPSQAMYRSASA